MLLQLLPLLIGLSITLAAVICSIVGLCSEEKKTWSFIVACLLNGFAMFSLLYAVLCCFVRGLAHAVDLFTFFIFGGMVCVGIAFLLMLFVLVLVIWKRNNYRPWKLFFYQVLTLTHCYLVYYWTWCILAGLIG